MPRNTKKTKKKVSGSRSSAKKHASGLVNAAVDATIELGHAAESLRDSIDHVGRARQRGRAVTKKIANSASRVKRTVVNTAKGVLKKKPSKRKRSRAKK